MNYDILLKKEKVKKQKVKNQLFNHNSLSTRNNRECVDKLAIFSIDKDQIVYEQRNSYSSSNNELIIYMDFNKSF